MRRSLVIATALVALTASGCASPPTPRRAVFRAPSVPLSQTATSTGSQLEVRHLPVRTSAARGAILVARLLRSQEGTLAVSLHQVRKVDATDPAVYVFAVTRSSVETIAAFPPRDMPVGDLSGGGWMDFMAKLPRGARSVRIASTVRNGSLEDSSTLWLEASVASIPVGPLPVFGPTF